MTTQAEKIQHADILSSKWLADGNAAEERGQKEKAERCFEKSQYWLDRLNKLLGNS